MRNLIRLWDKDFNLLWSNETGAQEEFDALITARTPQNRTVDFGDGSRRVGHIEYQDNGGATFHDYSPYLEKINVWANPLLEPEHQGKWTLPPDPFIPEAWRADAVIPDGPPLVYGRDYHFADGRERTAPATDNVVAVTVGTGDVVPPGRFRLRDLWRQLRQWRS